MAIDQFHDQSFKRLYHLFTEHPESEDFIKSAQIDHEENEKRADSAFVWPERRMFPIDTPAQAALSRLYMEKQAGVPDYVRKNCEKALAIYGVELPLQEKVAAAPDPDEYLLLEQKRFRVTDVETVKLAADAIMTNQRKMDAKTRAQACVGLVKKSMQFGAVLPTKMLAYVSYRDRNPDLYGLDLETGRRWKISGESGLNISPAWSTPNGKRIAAALSRDGSAEIYTMDRSGGDRERLTYGSYDNVSPAWSPNGREMVFTSGRGVTPQLYIMNVDGSDVRRITFEGAYNASPRWSPRGDRIVFVTEVGRVFKVATIRPDGSDLQILTAGPGSDENPSWSPSGRHILFASNREGKHNLYLMTPTAPRANGSRRTTRTTSLLHGPRDPAGPAAMGGYRAPLPPSRCEAGRAPRRPADLRFVPRLPTRKGAHRPSGYETIDGNTACPPHATVGRQRPAARRLSVHVHRDPGLRHYE